MPASRHAVSIAAMFSVELSLLSHRGLAAIATEKPGHGIYAFAKKPVTTLTH
jgi:hypothetical protein